MDHGNTLPPLDLRHTARPIGLTLRANWLPMAAQSLFLEFVATADIERRLSRWCRFLAVPQLRFSQPL
jgi:hypothetical protein